MPCYRPSWNHQLQPGTQAYAEAKSSVDTSRRATYHVIDYYLRVCGLPLPMPDPDDSEIMAEWKQLVTETSRLAPRDLGAASIARYGFAAFLIANHLSCDGVDFEDLWDQQSIIETSDPRDLGYGWIIRWCVGVMNRRFENEGWSIQLARREKS